MDISGWLRQLGLEEYEESFRANAIEPAVLPSLTAEDLKDLGVVRVGHRRLLLDAIAALRAGGALGEGAALVSEPAPKPESAAPSVGAERRHLTLLFCDLVDSTPLAARLDPEDLREVIAAYHAAVSTVVAQFGGFVAKYMGDGVLAYFGYPQAHEEDAERAVRAALAIVEAVAGLGLAESLAVRLGIASGSVVVGDLIGAGAAREQAVVGETPNLAARLQGLAGANEIMIAEATRRQVGSLFAIRDRGEHALKGFPGAQPVWQVVGESGIASRFEALRSGATPLVGREEELDLLLRRWAQVREGEGRVVLISAEAGIGKSRLAAAVAERIGGEVQARLRYSCSPHHQDSALYPVVVQLERAAGFIRDDPAPVRRQKLAALFPGSPAADLALLAELLSLPAAEKATGEPELTPQRRKEKTFEALLRALEQLSRRGPVLMLFEDVHWVDPTSRELLDRTIAAAERLPILLITTYRPEFQAPWSGQPHVTVLTLSRLGRRDGAALVQWLAGNAALPADLVEEVIERTDGVPLFLEEVTKALIETAGRADAAQVRRSLAAIPGARLAIPATLQASLLARLDRLGPAAREIAQTGSAIGREFSHELLAAVASRSETETQAALGQLVAAGLLFQRGAPPAAEYQFKHALVGDTAYGTLLRARRQELHGRIGAALQRARDADRVAVRPEILAHHLAQAGAAAPAIACLREAAEAAAAHWANAEAVRHLNQARELAAQLGDETARREAELTILLDLGPALIRLQGLFSPALVDVYSRAQSLCGPQTEPSQRFAASWGAWHVLHFQGRWGDARQQADELITLAQTAQDQGLLLQAHHSAWSSLVILGDDHRVLHHAEEGIALYDIAAHRSHAARYGGHDPGVCAKMVAGMAAWIVGFPQRAGAYSAAAIELGQALGDPFSLAMALSFGASVAMLRREPAIVEARCVALQQLLEEHAEALGHFRSTAKMLRGWAAATAGALSEGRALALEGLGETRASGFKRLSFQLGLTAELHRLAGDLAAAQQVLGEAAQVVEETGERRWLCQILREEGLVADAAHDPQLAEAVFRQALAVAQQQRASSFELRVATSLARLWDKEGRQDEARDLLGPVFGRFTEGFDTPDLIEAKALLQALA